MLILEDFNIHVNVLSDPDTMKFLDLLGSLGLEQHVDRPTHIRGHALDLAITRKASSIIQTSPRVDRYFSDHGSVVCDLKLRKPTYKVKTISYRKLKSVDMDRFHDDLASSSLCTVSYSGVHSPASLEKFVENYESKLSNLIDHHAPIKTKTVRSRPQVPWYNEVIAEAKRQRRKVEKIWRKSKLTSDYSLFKAKRNHAMFLINKARKVFYADFIEKNSSDQGKLFRGMEKLLAPKETLHFTDYRDNCILANDIGKFFNHKISYIRKELDASINASDTDTNTVPDDPVLDCIQHLSEFRGLSCEEVQSIIQKSAKKTCSLDPMPTSMVVACLEELLPVITRLVNSSLSLGHFFWPILATRIEYKIVVNTFKTIHGMAPKYLHDLIDIRQNRHYNLRSNKGIVLCDASGKRTLGDRSFRAAAPKIWNKLPDDVKVSQKLDTFKRKLKTHYFKLAFSILH